MEQCNKIFLPVKIAESKWAEALLNGQVYMKSMYSFGPWSATENAKKSNGKDYDFRHDVLEGLVANVDLATGDDAFAKALDPKIRTAMRGLWYIDDACQYTKIYCMYCLTYDLNTNKFEPPDDRLTSMANTAVIIHNPAEFMYRLRGQLVKDFGRNFIFRADSVSYYTLANDYGNHNPIFSKEKHFAWQKEYRIAIDLLDGNYSVMAGKGLQTLQPQVQDVDPLILEIGDLRDVAVAIPTVDLIKLKLPPEICLLSK